jgi:Glycosyltransferases involved in cell wall biogenesis
MNKTPEISVILPVYNAEKYLSQCLDSIIGQTFDNIEIICVDDGSSDGSLEILKKYASNDDRFIIICQKNSGAATARNRGIEAAKGNHLSILDCDDFFEPSMLKEMHDKALKTDADITICMSQKYNDITGDFFEKGKNVKIQILPQKDIFNYTDIKNHLFSFAIGWSWDKLYRRAFVERNSLRFQNIRSSNDLFFVFLSFVKAEKMTVLQKILVSHRVNTKTSLSETREKDPMCFYLAVKHLKEKLELDGIFKEIEQAFVNWALHFSLWHLNTNKNNAIIYTGLRKYVFPGLRLYKYDKKFFYNRKDYKALLKIKRIPFWLNAIYKKFIKTAQLIFSVKNENKYKIITIIGFKIAFKRKR